MEIIRKELTPDEISPPGIRYNTGTDAFERFINGEWVETPETDPRRQNVFPPVDTGSPSCDGAANIVVNLQGLIAGMTNAVCTGADVALGAATLVTALYLLNVLFGLLMSLAMTLFAAALTAGCSEMEDTFTPTVWDQLKCILADKLDGDGRLTEATWAAAKSDITAKIGGTPAAILVGLFDIIGFGGLNSMAATGAETGDCSECFPGCSDFGIGFDAGVPNYCDVPAPSGNLGLGRGQGGEWSASGGRTSAGCIKTTEVAGELVIQFQIDLGEECSINRANCYRRVQTFTGGANFLTSLNMWSAAHVLRYTHEYATGSVTTWDLVNYDGGAGAFATQVRYIVFTIVTTLANDAAFLDDVDIITM